MDFLSQLSKIWLSKITIAAEVKEDVFGRHARDAMRFYRGPYDFLYDSVYSEGSISFVVEGVRAPAFKMSVNKVAELVQLFLPVLYHRNPVFSVHPKFLDIDPNILIQLFPPELLQQAAVQAQQAGKPFNPLEMLRINPQKRAGFQVAARLLQYLLNQLTRESDLKTQARLAITESLIKGRGLLWTEIIQSPTGLMVTSQYDSVDFLQLDPDAETIRECQWIARKRRQPIHHVEQKFRLRRGSLEGDRMSYNAEGDAKAPTDETERDRKMRGRSYDVIEYHEIYSRIGIGGWLAGMEKEMRDKLAGFGDNIYLVVSKGVPYPLNMSPDFLNTATEAELRSAISWPTPFHEDTTNPWPFVHFDFHDIPRSIWPMAHIRPAMGELKALQWIMSFLVGKIKNISRDFVVVDKTIDDSIKDSIVNGPDLTMLEVVARGNKAVGDFVHFIQHPDVNKTIWEVAAALERSFEKRTGITELAQGIVGGPQMRSATEAQMRGQQLSVRPDDMANRVEDAMSSVARSQAIAMRVHMSGEDVAPIFGEAVTEAGPQLANGELMSQAGPLTSMYDRYLGGQDVATIVSEFTFRVEAGSARKPNKQQAIAQANEGMQTLSQIFFQYYAQTGDAGPANHILRKYYTAMDWDDNEQAYFPDRQQQMMQQQQGAPQGEPPPVQKGP